MKNDAKRGDVRPSVLATNVDPGADEYDPPTCLPVANLATQDVTLDGVTITFDGVGAVFEYEIVLAGAAQGTGTIVVSTSDSIVVTGLQSSTAYDVYVREVCNRGVFSAWVSTSFATANGIPFVEDFETFPAGNINNPWPNGWTTTAYNGFGWESEDASGVNENSIGT